MKWLIFLICTIFLLDCGKTEETLSSNVASNSDMSAQYSSQMNYSSSSINANIIESAASQGDNYNCTIALQGKILQNTTTKSPYYKRHYICDNSIWRLATTFEYD